MLRLPIVLMYSVFSTLLVLTWYLTTGAYQVSLPLSPSTLASLRSRLDQLYPSGTPLGSVPCLRLARKGSGGNWDDIEDVLAEFLCHGANSDTRNELDVLVEFEDEDLEIDDSVTEKSESGKMMRIVIQQGGRARLRSILEKLRVFWKEQFQVRKMDNVFSRDHDLPYLAQTYQLIFTFVVSDPTQKRVTLDFESALPFFDRMHDVVGHVFPFKVRSQVVEYGELPKAKRRKKGDQGIVILEDQMERLINVNPWWSLESIEDPTAHSIHFLLYIPREEEFPVRVEKSDHDFVIPVAGSSLDPSFVVQGWGGVRIANDVWQPNEDPLVLDWNSTLFQSFIGTFVGQLRWILGIRDPDTAEGAFLTEASLAGFSLWEIEALARRFARANAAKAILVLSALERVAATMHRLSIGELVRDEVVAALGALDRHDVAVLAGNFSEAAVAAREAMAFAKHAYEHPSMSNEQYFPLTQKLGVYMPVVLPLVVNVFKLLKHEVRRWRRKRRYLKDTVDSNAPWNKAL